MNSLWFCPIYSDLYYKKKLESDKILLPHTILKDISETDKIEYKKLIFEIDNLDLNHSKKLITTCLEFYDDFDNTNITYVPEWFLNNLWPTKNGDFIKINLDYQKNSCILVGSMGGFLSTFNGPTHQSIDEIYLIGNLANFDVFFPATEYEMVLFIKKFNFSRSVYIRYNPINNKILNKVINKNYKPNKKLIGNGKNIIISYGVCSEQIFKILHENKFLKNKFKLYNFSLITNLNKTFFLYLAKKSNNLLIVEDHVNKGSLSEKIKVLLYENKIKINLISKNLGNKYFQPKKTLDELFKKYDITKKYLENLNFKQ